MLYSTIDSICLVVSLLTKNLISKQKCRRILHPILWVAKQEPEYCYKSRMEGSKLVIDGKRYGVNDLGKLPQKLSPYEVSIKTSDETIGFFGKLCPFSNFYLVNFTHNGVTYHSSKQLIQYQKALYCNDHDSAERILSTKTAIACKQLSYSIQNCNHQGWLNAVNEQCWDGLRAKFLQNPNLLRTLLSTGDKTISRELTRQCMGYWCISV